MADRPLNSPDPEEEDVRTIPVYREDLVAGTTPVVTGGVRVVKHTESHEQIVEQQLRKSHAEVKRVQINQVVDGPQQPRRSGNTLIVPVVSEVLKIEKQWVLTEEIHITQTEEITTEQQPVQLKEEHAIIERTDAEGNVVSTEADPLSAPTRQRIADAPVRATRAAAAAATSTSAPVRRKILSKTPGILKTPID